MCDLLSIENIRICTFIAYQYGYGLGWSWVVHSKLVQFEKLPKLYYKKGKVNTNVGSLGV